MDTKARVLMEKTEPDTEFEECLLCLMDIEKESDIYNSGCMHKYCIPCATNMRKNLNKGLNIRTRKLFEKHAPEFQCPMCKPPGWTGPLAFFEKTLLKGKKSLKDQSDTNYNYLM